MTTSIALSSTSNSSSIELQVYASGSLALDLYQHGRIRCGNWNEGWSFNEPSSIANVLRKQSSVDDRVDTRSAGYLLMLSA